MTGNDRSLSRIIEIMTGFADQTGLSSSGNIPRRYLWTDAFAVCNFLELYRRTGEPEYKELALRLVDQVHTILGRHREDDERTGWISGLTEEEGVEHPTIGGLRIGKKLNERRPGDDFDEDLEWERDGQYYHYLTKWMHALNCVSHVTEDAVFLIRAIELAKTAHARFTYLPLAGRRKRMRWKMSIDLSYPLVVSMGQLDPLDGLVTYHQLKSSAKRFTGVKFPDLAPEIADMAAMCEGASWVSDDPLGIGDLLIEALKLIHLIISEDIRGTDLLVNVLEASSQGLQYFAGRDPLKLPAAYRLAFREFGLSVGLHAVEKGRELIGQNAAFFGRKDPVHGLIEAIMEYTRMADTIEQFWLDPANRKADTWTEHQDINAVMLATSLLPEGYFSC